MKRESVFFTISISFIISVLLVVVSFIGLVVHTQDEKEQYLSKKYLPVAKMILEKQRNYGLTKEFLESLSNMQLEFLNNIGSVRAITYNPQTDVLLERRFKSILIRVLQLKRESYLFIKNGRLEIMLKDNDSKHMNPLIFLVGVFGVILVTLIIAFLTTWRKLYPLKILKDKVKTLGDENFDFDCCNMDGKDEVSLLAMEFKHSAERLKNIKEARNVFIRNIMHELKTPITKGKFLSELEHSEQNDEKMKRVFSRLELLINEFTCIEELISSTKNVEKNLYFIDDIIDNAMDILMLDEDIIIMQHENKKIEVNFKLFSVAVKNLIDNGMKYSTDKKVTIRTDEEDNIIFENDGNALAHPLKNYFEPFFANEDKSKDGFGLGLYIVNAILHANDYELQYEYVDNKNIFKICKQQKKDN
jgi:two-component system OmpR family sensor kinase